MLFFLRSAKGLLIFCLLLAVLSSCGRRNKKSAGIDEFFTTSRFDEDDFAEAFQKSYNNIISDSNWSKKKLPSVSDAVGHLYQTNGFFPVWITETGGADLPEKLLGELQLLNEEGLNPERYKLQALKDAISKFKTGEEVSVEVAINLDTICTRSYLQASRDLLIGRVRPVQVDSLWFHKNDTVWNAHDILLNSVGSDGSYISLDSFRSKIAMYQLLVNAKKHYQKLAVDSQFVALKNLVKADKTKLDSLFVVLVKTELPFRVGSGDDTSDQGRSQILNSFQTYYGLNPTGKFDDRTLQYLTRVPDTIIWILDANLERLRWMPQQLEDEYIIVDIPMMELFLQRSGENTMQMNVVVGKTVRQTPSLNATMTNIVFNPPWGVPPTILKKDVIPGMQRKGKAYLREKDLKVFDRKGNPVDASRVTVSNYRQFVFKQPPGDDNALGYIKFNLPNDHDIYLHDTPHREMFDIYDRAQSSGCVRVQKPRELAEYILVEMDKQNFSRDVVDSIIRTQKTKYQTLKNKIPVHIVYMTAFGGVSDQSIRFARDIYKRDLKLIAALQQG